MASRGGDFLGGAKGRLLPAALIFRYFASAVFFQLLAWLALFLAAPALPTYAGGLGWPLAALHLVTLGVLVMTAVATSLQLLPVASRQAVASRPWPYDLVWALLCLGTLALTAGMAWRAPAGMLAGAIAVALALLIYLLLLLQNLRGARGMPLVLVHCWAAALSLLVLLGSGAALVGAYSGFNGLQREVAQTLHITFGAFGFMGMLVLGFSYILMPMFALADNPAPRWSKFSVTLASVALTLALLTALDVFPRNWFALAIVVGGLAFVVHVALMLQALHNGMRQRLGQSFVLVRIGWVALAASFAVALALEAQVMAPNGPTLFAVLLIGGLLTFLLGVLSRIVPFLAAMHAATGQRRPPTPSGLTAQWPLSIHFYSHITALISLLVALASDSVWLIRFSAMLGLVGAVAFGIFFATVWRRMTPTRQV